MKDGLIFSHLESLYERGLNTLVLHWRDTNTSIYCGSSQDDQYNDGMIDAVLRLNDNYEFETLEEDILQVSIFCPNRVVLGNLQTGKVYHLRIKIDIDQVSKAA